MNLLKSLFLLSLTFFIIGGANAQNFNKRKYRPRFASPKQQHRAHKASEKESKTAIFESTAADKSSREDETIVKETHKLAVGSFIGFLVGALAFIGGGLLIWSSVPGGLVIGLLLGGALVVITSFICSIVSIGQISKDPQRYNDASKVLAAGPLAIILASILIGLSF